MGTRNGVLVSRRWGNVHSATRKAWPTRHHISCAVASSPPTSCVERRYRAFVEFLHSLYTALLREIWIVEPALHQTVQPAIYNPDDLDRVTGVWEGSSIRREVELLKGALIEHAATVAYRLRAVSVVGGALYGGRWKERLLTNRTSPFGLGPVVHRSGG